MGPRTAERERERENETFSEARFGVFRVIRRQTLPFAIVGTRNRAEGATKKLGEGMISMNIGRKSWKCDCKHAGPSSVQILSGAAEIEAALSSGCYTGRPVLNPGEYSRHSGTLLRARQPDGGPSRVPLIVLSFIHTSINYLATVRLRIPASFHSDVLLRMKGFLK